MGRIYSLTISSRTVGSDKEEIKIVGNLFWGGFNNINCDIIKSEANRTPTYDFGDQYTTTILRSLKFK